MKGVSRARVKGVSSGAEWAFGVGCVPLALISAGFGGFVFCAYFLSRPSWRARCLAEPRAGLALATFLLSHWPAAPESAAVENYKEFMVQRSKTSTTPAARLNPTYKLPVS